MYNKKYFIIFLFLISFLLINCSSYKSALLNETEKIIIYIYGRENGNIINDFYKIEIINKDEIKKIINYTTGIISPAYKCGYQGKIDYYCKNNNLILDMKFNTDCNTIVFVYDDKLFTRRISKDGLIYLENIINNVPEENRF
jgi:hypothetical protein